MNKQFLSAITMLSCILLLACTSVQAQFAHTLVADIPFDFTVGKKSMPAGTYSVRSVSRDSGTALSIQSTDGDASMFLTHAVQSDKARERGRLVFRRYGGQYFLMQIWSPYGTFGRELPLKHIERAMERELAKQTKTPEKASAPQYVTLLARVQ